MYELIRRTPVAALMIVTTAAVTGTLAVVTSVTVGTVRSEDCDDCDDCCCDWDTGSGD